LRPDKQVGGSNITQNDLRFVLRTILISRDRYLSHLRSSRAHDNSSIGSADIAHLGSLPDWFYMVEFSLPALYTGNRSKLGEVLIEGFTPPDPADQMTSLLAVRLPGLLILRDAAGQLTATAISMTAHSPVYRNRPHHHVW
jgi:hypothetical protein